MPHAALKIVPGVDTNKTPALNEAAVSFANLIRFMPDRNGMGLAQKLGGWQQYVNTTFVGAIRSLKSWADLEQNNWLAVGSSGPEGLDAFNITNSQIADVTPRQIIDDFTPNSTTKGFSTNAGSDFVSVFSDADPSASYFVYFPTTVSVGNLLLLGAYEISNVTATAYDINVNATTPIASIVATTSGADRIVVVSFSSPHNFQALMSIDVANVAVGTLNGTFTIDSVTPLTITYTQTGVNTTVVSYGGTVNANVNFGGVPPEYSTTINSSTVTVTLVNHNLLVGDDFNAPISTTVAGVTIFGLYKVVSLTDENNFQIVGNTAATSTTSAFENGGNIRENILVGLRAEYAAGNNSVYGGTAGSAYSEGVYSTGEVPLGDPGTPITATDWSLENWGEILISAPVDYPIYYWQPSGGEYLNCAYIPNAPLVNEGAFVAMPQRQIIAYGSSFGLIQDPLLLRWCDVEDFSIWTAQAINQAGSYRIPTGNRIVGAVQAAQQAYVWTDLDLWAMQYIGAPYVYGFNKIGSNCGLISRKAMGQLSGITYWMSQKQFFRVAGSGAEPIPCTVWDQVFQNLYVSPTTGEVDADGKPWVDRIRCAPNTQFNEVSWFFPAASVPVLDANGVPTGATVDGNGENNAYVKYNIALNQWDYGYQDPNDSNVLVSRTAWIDQSVLGAPVAAATTASVSTVSPTSFIYQHEVSNNANGYALKPYFRTGYFAISEGDEQLFIDQVWPDMKWGMTDGSQDANVNITFYVTNYPGNTPAVFGPYDMTQATEFLSVRMRGRLISVAISSTDENSFWRLGNIRYRYQPDGKY